MKIERGEDPGLVCVKGYAGIVLRVREFQPDLTDELPNNNLWTDLRPSWGHTNNSLAAICEVFVGEAPDHWETCNPYGHFRVNVENLRRLSALELLGAQYERD